MPPVVMLFCTKRTPPKLASFVEYFSGKHFTPCFSNAFHPFLIVASNYIVFITNRTTCTKVKQNLHEFMKKYFPKSILKSLADDE